MVSLAVNGWTAELPCSLRSLSWYPSTDEQLAAAGCLPELRLLHLPRYSGHLTSFRGGDSFASGFIYGLMELGDPAKAIEYGAAHGALAMTTPGDTTMASLAEVEKLVAGAGARVDR